MMPGAAPPAKPRKGSRIATTERPEGAEGVETEGIPARNPRLSQGSSAGRNAAGAFYILQG